MRPADYLLDTLSLTLTQHGVYCLLMFSYYWEGGLPAGEAIYNTAHATTPESRADVDLILSRFFHLENERWIHHRIERELEKTQHFSRSQSEKGKASAAARAAIPKTIGTKPPAETLTLPDWLNAETWASWIKIRPAKARTVDAQRAAIGKLEKFKAAGYEANAIVADSLANGWQGLFAPDGKPKGGKQEGQRTDFQNLDYKKGVSDDGKF